MTGPVDRVAPVAISRRRLAALIVASAGAPLFGAGPARPGESAFAPRGWPDLPETARVEAGLSVRFMGASTLLIEDGRHSVLIDGFFSRPSLTRFLATRISPHSGRIADALRRGRIEALSLVIVAHSHHDHAMDSAVVARPAGAQLAGSDSVRSIAEGAGFPMERFRSLTHGTTLETGPPNGFTITSFETPHSPQPLFTGPITGPLRTPAWGRRYRGGRNFSFLIEHPEANLLVQPSANFVCGGYEGRQAAIVFLSIGGLARQSRDFFETCWRETVLRVGARVAVLTHWDDFFVPLDQPLRPMRRLIDDVTTTLAWVEAAAARDGIRVAIPPAFRPAPIAHLLSDLPPSAEPGPASIPDCRKG